MLVLVLVLVLVLLEAKKGPRLRAFFMDDAWPVGRSCCRRTLDAVPGVADRLRIQSGVRAGEARAWRIRAPGAVATGSRR